MKSDNILEVPTGAGKAILQSGGVFVCKLLNSDKFVSFCKDRTVNINRERLKRLERLGLFSPVFRVSPPEDATESFNIPITQDNDWFDTGWAIDTAGSNKNNSIPMKDAKNCECYYSMFQIYYLEILISSFSFNIEIDSFLDESQTPDWGVLKTDFFEYANRMKDIYRPNNPREAIALLCQFISDRYAPQAMTNARTISVLYGSQIYIDKYMNFQSLDWDWGKMHRGWDPHVAEKKFNLTPEKIKNAYESLGCYISRCDPLDNWYQLIQFISTSERSKLKDKALLAETLRLGAYMIRLFYKDLYGEDLPHPHEISRQIINPIPELEIRNDTIKYLEFVANRYQINPRPKLTLFLEGESEEAAVLSIFKKYYGIHPGKVGIEIIVLRGVDNATGSKIDRYRAILRLVDYLHHHQTITFLILDNENHAPKLKEEAAKAPSILHVGRKITRLEYVNIWSISFEFDNFSEEEISSAMTSIAQGNGVFYKEEVVACRQDKNPGSSLEKLYSVKTSCGLNKVNLAKQLVDTMVSSREKQNITSRPLMKILDRVWELASHNPFPIMQKSYQINQSSKILGGQE